MATSPPVPQNAIEVFFSYAHVDEALRDELAKHLSLLERQGIIAAWHDRRIAAGTRWADAIDTHLQTAHVILLLVSADFLASNYCYDVEVKQAMARHEAGDARVIPIILRSVDWQPAPFGNLQALPKDSRPVTSWANQDEAFFDIARGIRSVAEELAQNPVMITPTDIWNVTFLRNRNFVGRESVLQDIKNTLAPGKPVVLHGMPGVGKTQIAIEYAYRYAADYDIVWWLRADTTESLAEDMAALAQPLGRSDTGGYAESAYAVAAVLDSLKYRERWLLILDDALKPETLPEKIFSFLEGVRQTGHMLITSRTAAWVQYQESLGLHPQPIGLLSLEESVEFLVRSTGLQEKTDDAKGLAEELGCLPIALKAASSFIQAQHRTFSDYLELFQGHQTAFNLTPDQLAEFEIEATATEEQKTVNDFYTAWSLSFAQVKAESQSAAAFLNLCSFFARDAIPVSMFREHAGCLPSPLSEALLDDETLKSNLETLARYSLIDWDRGSGTVSVHNLVQLVARNQLAVKEKKEFGLAALKFMTAAFPFLEYQEHFEEWETCGRLLPHATIVAGLVENWLGQIGELPEYLGDLLTKCGLYLFDRKAFGQALRNFQRVYTIDIGHFGPDHPIVARDYSNLGWAHKDLGQLTDAAEHFTKALGINQLKPDPHNPTIATTHHNLGWVLMDLHHFEEAKQHFEQALRIDEMNFGLSDPNVARDWTDLGHVKQRLSDPAEAAEYFERALNIHRDELDRLRGSDGGGPTSQNLSQARRQKRLARALAEDFANLGTVQQALGKLEEAKRNFEQALKIDEETLGLDNPTTARAHARLGLAMKDLGDLEAARDHFGKALAIDEQAFGPSHPWVAEDHRHLAILFKDQHNLARAKEHISFALRIDQEDSCRESRPDGPTVARDLIALGWVLKDSTDFDEAEKHFRRALEILQGNPHPEYHCDMVAEAYSGLGWSMKDRADVHKASGGRMQEKEHLEQAKQHFEKTLEIRRGSALYSTDFGVADAHTALGWVLKDFGHIGEAKEHFEQALRIHGSRLDASHPKVMEDVKALVKVLEELANQPKPASNP